MEETVKPGYYIHLLIWVDMGMCVGEGVAYQENIYESHNT